jgi:hypothetical protein
LCCMVQLVLWTLYDLRGDKLAAVKAKAKALSHDGAEC